MDNPNVVRRFFGAITTLVRVVFATMTVGRARLVRAYETWWIIDRRR